MDTYDKKRKVVLVRGDKNKLYEQAIFILREGVAEENIDFVKEAEKIINKQGGAIHWAGKQGSGYAAGYVMPQPMPPVNYAKAEMLPAPAPAASKKTAKKSGRLDIMLNFALILTGITILALFILNMM